MLSLLTALVPGAWQVFFFFFFALVTGPRRSLSLKLSDTQVYEPQIRARLGNHNTTILGFCRNSLLTLEPGRYMASLKAKVPKKPETPDA